MHSSLCLFGCHFDVRVPVAVLRVELLDQTLHVADQLGQILFGGYVAGAIGRRYGHLLQHQYAVHLPGQLAAAKVLREHCEHLPATRRGMLIAAAQQVLALLHRLLQTLIELQVENFNKYIQIDCLYSTYAQQIEASRWLVKASIRCFGLAYDF